MRDVKTGADVRLNFIQENKLQKKHSPLYLKRIPKGWKEEILKQLPRVLSPSPLVGEGRGEGLNLIDIFKSVDADNAADFCLEMYKKMGLLDGIEIVKSSDKNFREKALDLQEYFADVNYQGEVVRAQLIEGKLQLHEGGGKYTVLSEQKIERTQKNPARDERFAWMQSIIHCTHYIFGEGEKEYLKTADFPEVKFVDREKIDQSGYAYILS
jgi:hypothetical protein